MIAAATLLIFLLLALVITRVATVALRATGLSHEAARFQARSAFSGVGFTTNESEDVVNHPARRNIVLILMLLSTAGVVTAISSLLLSFVDTTSWREAALRAAVILGGLLLVWLLAASDWVEQRLSRLIERGLRRWTDLDVADYVRLLHISRDYSITEMGVAEDEWLNGRRVGDILLAQEGVVVLGIRRPIGEYISAPPVGTAFGLGDTLVVYGRLTALDELRLKGGDRQRRRRHRHGASGGGLPRAAGGRGRAGCVPFHAPRGAAAHRNKLDADLTRELGSRHDHHRTHRRTIDGKELPAPGRWTIDPSHSSAVHRPAHDDLEVRGRFRTLVGTILVAEIPSSRPSR
jgi:hypothetical protein